MARKVPVDEAFAFYLELGAGRSYAAVAKKFGVNKRSIVKIAARDRWQARITEVETKARQAAEKKAAESLAGLTDRHLRTVRFLEARALDALRSTPIRTAGEAARMLDISLRQERSLLGLDGAATAETRNAELAAFKKKL